MIGFPFDSQVTYASDGTPIFDRAVSSAPLRQLIKKMLSNGVLPNPSTNLQVQPGSGMNVIVNPGFAVIEGGLKYEETQRTLAVQASDSAYDRIDTVVMRWNDNTNARSCDLYVIQGVPAVSPARPSLNREGSVYELGLADLFIAANSSAISAARITDTRYESERCGIISSISEFDSDTIYAQIQADLSEFKEEEQASFIEWFENIKTQLSGDVAGNLQLQINDLKTSDTKDNTVSFTSGDAEEAEAFVAVELLTGGEKHVSLWQKVSLMFKNVRRLMKLVGSTDISNIFDGTLTGAVSGLNSKLDSKQNDIGFERIATTHTGSDVDVKLTDGIFLFIGFQGGSLAMTMLSLVSVAGYEEASYISDIVTAKVYNPTLSINSSTKILTITPNVAGFSYKIIRIM